MFSFFSLGASTSPYQPTQVKLDGLFVDRYPHVLLVLQICSGLSAVLTCVFSDICLLALGFVIPIVYCCREKSGFGTVFVGF